MDPVVLVTLNDGLMFPSGFVSNATYACAIYCRVPEAWLAGDSLRKDIAELIPEYLYGRHFRNGNDDGSRYVYANLQSRRLTEAEVAAEPWKPAVNTKEFRFWFCHAVPATNAFKSVEREAF